MRAPATCALWPHGWSRRDRFRGCPRTAARSGRYGGWFGWIGWWQRPVAVPIELVALIGPHVGALDMTPEQFRNAPTWQPSADSREIGPDETIRVAITRR